MIMTAHKGSLNQYFYEARVEENKVLSKDFTPLLSLSSTLDSLSGQVDYVKLIVQ